MIVKAVNKKKPEYNSNKILNCSNICRTINSTLVLQHHDKGRRWVTRHKEKMYM